MGVVRKEGEAVNRDGLLTLLAELIACHAPPGDEREIDAVIRRHWEATGAKVWQDEATNLYAHWEGRGLKVMVCAHKDEVAMVVTDITDDGRLRVENCGGSWAWKYGEGPVDLLADDGSIVQGILSVGSVHTNIGPVHELKTSRALTWDLVTVFTGLSKAELITRGIHVGTRAVVSRDRKKLYRLGDYIASFALDDRMGLTALIALAQEAAHGSLNPSLDLYFVATTQEETGCIGAVRAAELLKPDLVIALDTSPVAYGLPLVVDSRPVIWCRETVAGSQIYHTKSECDTLLRLAEELGFGAQLAFYTAAASDAGRVRSAGLAGQTVCLGFARDNSHGFEIAHADSLSNVLRLVAEYLRRL